MSRKEIHGVAALLLVMGGLSFVFTSSVEGAFAGLGLTLAAAGVMLYGSTRPRD